MKFVISSEKHLKGLEAPLQMLPQDIADKIPNTTQGLTTNILYEPTLIFFIDLSGDIEEYAKIRALEMYLRDNHIQTNFLYKPLLHHQFRFHIDDNYVRAFTQYFLGEYIIESVSIDHGTLKAKIKKVIS